MDNAASNKRTWRLWRWRRRRKNFSIQNNSEPPEIARSEHKAERFEALELASAMLVVVSVLAEEWDILPKAAYSPASKDGIKALAAISVATFIALEILFSQFAKKHDGIVRGWQARRIAELNLETERLRKENNETALLLGYRSVGDLSAFVDAMRPFSGTRYQMYVYAEDTIPNEVATLQWNLNIALTRAGWISAPEPRPMRHRQLNFGVAILTVHGPKSMQRSEAGYALADWLDGKEIACLVGLIRDDVFSLQDVTLKIMVGPKPETIEHHQHLRSVYREQRNLP